MNIPLPDLQSRTLPNGFRIVSVEDHSNPVLCLQLYIKTGSTHESRSQRGFSHFIEHLVFKSTQAYPDNAISRKVTELGGMLNAYTDYDTTCYYLLLPSEHLEAGLHILSQLARHSTFTEADVNLEKAIILEEIKQYRNDPESDYLEWIQKGHFRKSPLKYPVLGSETSVGKADWKRIKAFQSKSYRPQNAYLIVCGDYANQTLNELTESYFRDWKAGRRKLNPLNDLEPELPQGSYRFRKKPDSEYLLSFILPELSEKHPLADALHIVMRYFAIGKASRLFKNLVEEKQLCSYVKVSSLTGILSGASAIVCSPLSPRHIPRIISRFASEFASLLANGIPADELSLVKKDIIHSWLFSFEGMENLANLLAVEESLGNLDRLRNYGDKIAAVSPEQIRQAIAIYWQPRYVELFCEGNKPLRGIKARFEDIALQVPLGLETSSSPKQAQESFSPPQTMHDSLSMLREGLMACPPSQLSHESLLPLENVDKAKPGEAAMTPDSASVPANANSPLPIVTLASDGTSKQLSNLSAIAENHYRIILANGMKLLYRRLENKTVAGFSLSSNLSQLSETESQTGQNFFASSLMLYSTQLHSHAQLMKIGRETGFNIRVVHHLDSTAYRGKCLTESLPLALSLLSEIVSTPLFDARHLSLLKKSALDGIRRDNEHPVSHAYHQWFRMLVGTRTNLFRSSGEPSDIRKLNCANLEAWFKAWNLAGNFSLALVSSHHPEYIAELCDSLFNVPERVTTLTPQPFYRKQSEMKLIQSRKTDQAIIHLGGFACPAQNREENAAFYLLAQILGGDISSRFYDILREKHGLAYQTGFDFSSINTLGFWNAYAFCDKRSYQTCLALMQDILDGLMQNEVSEAELQAAKNYLIGMNRFDLESVSYSAASMANLSALGYEPEYYLNRETRIRAVDSAAIKAVAVKYLSHDNRYLHILV